MFASLWRSPAAPKQHQQQRSKGPLPPLRPQADAGVCNTTEGPFVTVTFFMPTTRVIPTLAQLNTSLVVYAMRSSVLFYTEYLNGSCALTYATAFNSSMSAWPGRGWATGQGLVAGSWGWGLRLRLARPA